MITASRNGCWKVKHVSESLSNTVWIFKSFINSASFKYYLLDALRELLSEVEPLLENIYQVPITLQELEKQHKQSTEARNSLIYLGAQNRLK